MSPSTAAISPLRQRMIEAIKAHNPAFDDAAATDEQIEAAFLEAKVEAKAVKATPAQATQQADGYAKAAADAMDQVRLVEARITARELVILKTARIEGDVHYDALTIEQGAEVDGRFAPNARTVVKPVPSVEAAE